MILLLACAISTPPVDTADTNDSGSPNDTSDTSDSGDTSDSSDSGGTKKPVETAEGDCDVSSTEKVAHRLLFQGHGSGQLVASSGMVFRDEKSWKEALAASSLDGAVGSLDWENERMVVASVAVSSTCGLVFDSYQVRPNASGSDTGEYSAVLDLTVRDPTGLCEGTCEAEDAVLVIVAVASISTPGTCARRVDECA